MRRSLTSSMALVAAIAAVTALLSGSAVNAQTSETPTAAPLNPAFVDYMLTSAGRLEGEQAADGQGLGYIPPPVVLNHSRGHIVRPSALGYPASYDLRDLSKVTPVKNQGGCGSCWAFGTYGSLESYLLPGETWDFSENNLKNLSGFDYTCCEGGQYLMSTAYLARWSGPVSEADDPYSMSCTSASGLPIQKHVQSVWFLPQRSGPLDNDNIKDVVYNQGAVCTSFYYDGASYNSTTHSYYFGGSMGTNHAVAIVGWDDSYDRTRFNTLPPGNGAFIAKNSWGTYWGESGYFYVSYYDSLFANECDLFTASPLTNYARNYQYDPYGMVSEVGYASNTAWAANVFTAAAAEYLTAVGFYALSPGTNYTVYIYLDPTQGPINPGGAATTKTGTIDMPGYHTIDLDAAVALTTGRKFSVVLRLNTPGDNYPIAYEYPLSGYSSGATSSPGQSYISPSGTTWSDITTYYTNANVCVKAFTSQAGSLTVTPAAGLASSGTIGGPFSPSSKAYTLSNPGTATINWTATHGAGATWCTVSPASGALSPGNSTTVTVSINVNANVLPAGTYNDTVSFTNTTNGVGDTTRAVQLSIASPEPTWMVVTPSGDFSSSGPAGGPFTPDRLAYTVSNVADSPLDFSVTHDLGDNWLTLRYMLAAHASTSISAWVNDFATALGPGVYEDVIFFTNLTNGQGNTTRNATLNVTGAGLSVTPAEGLASSGNQGGPFSPSSKAYTLTNTGTTSISWTAAHNPGINWVTLSAASGNLAGGASTTVTVSINANANSLPGGIYNDVVTFKNTTSGIGNTTRGVELTVMAGALSVTPADGLTSTGNAGGPFSPPSRVYTLTNTGAAPINWTASHNPMANWVTLSGLSGTLNAGGSITVTVAINASADALPGGTYTDTVTFTNTTNGVGNTTRPVSLTVYQGSLSVTPADGLTSSGPVGGPFTPSSKQYTLANSGNISIDWTASHNPSVNWVTLSGTSGTLAAGASTTVTVTINANATSLGAGTYPDTVTFTNTTSGIGNTTRAVSLTAATKTLTSVTVSPTSLICPSNDPRRLHAFANFSDSSQLDISSLGTWTSSRTSVCTVSSSGVVTPRGAGMAAVTKSYTYGGVTRSASCSMNVSYQTVWYVYMSPSSRTFYNRTPFQFACQARTTTNWIDVTQVAEWSSSSPAVATVDWKGLVTPVSAGGALITAKYLYNGVYKAISASVDVR